MTVWIAVRGENCEGSRTLGVFATKEAAVKCAFRETAHFHDFTWTPDKNMSDCWENGCDYIMVTEWEVSQ